MLPGYHCSYCKTIIDLSASPFSLRKPTGIYPLTGLSRPLLRVSLSSSFSIIIARPKRRGSLHGTVGPSLRRLALRRHRSVSTSTSLYTFAVDARSAALVGVRGVAARVVDVQEVEGVDVAGNVSFRGLRDQRSAVGFLLGLEGAMGEGRGKERLSHTLADTGRC